MNKEQTLPEGWVWTQLQKITCSGGTINPTKSIPDEFLYIDIEAVDNTSQRIVMPKSIRSNEAPSRARMHIRKGDVIFSLVRPYLKNIAIVPLELDSQVASTAFCVLRPEENIESAFIYYFVQQNTFIESIKTYGDSPPAARDEEFITLPIPLAPLAEQQRIVAAIEQQFTRLDAGVAALHQAQKKLKRYRAAVLKAAVEGTLTAAWRAEHPATETGAHLLARILTERRAKWEADQRAKGKDPAKAKYQEPATPDTADLPELPEGWAWATFGQCFTVCVGATPSRQKSIFWNGNIPWISSGEVQFCHIRYARESITLEGLTHSSTQINPIGSVLIGMIGEGRTRGQVALLDIEACNNQNCAAIWVSQTPIPPLFIYYWLWSQYENTRSGSSGNNQPALNKSKVEQLYFPLPTLVEQEQIVSEVERRLSVVDEVEAELATNVKRAERLRQSILHTAFAGQLVPQDPADEPASALLERIRQERAEREDNGQKARGSKRTQKQSEPEADATREAALHLTLITNEEE